MSEVLVQSMLNSAGYYRKKYEKLRKEPFYIYFTTIKIF